MTYQKKDNVSWKSLDDKLNELRDEFDLEGMQTCLDAYQMRFKDGEGMGDVQDLTDDNVEGWVDEIGALTEDELADLDAHLGLL